MILREFGADDIPLLCRWISDAKANFLWCGPTFDFPLTSAQISTHIQKKEVSPFLALVDGEPVGYVDLYRMSASQVRLCRVLIASPESRGKGWGKQLVALALQVAGEQTRVEQVSLAVFESNQRAVGCYKSLGFILDESATKTRVFDGEEWTLLRMVKPVA